MNIYFKGSRELSKEIWKEKIWDMPVEIYEVCRDYSEIK